MLTSAHHTRAPTHGTESRGMGRKENGEGEAKVAHCLENSMALLTPVTGLSGSPNPCRDPLSSDRD